ncbi:MAG TPA: hypothetical protein VJJ83_05485, partial [Candidatus Babeliales bacterium]|nr:hypothetical protein [Candidatus Babeliales bacterium]
MKTKDLIALGILAVVLFVVGTLLINALGGGAQDRQAEIEIVQPLDPQYNPQAKEILLKRNPDVPVDNFHLPLDANQGVGNG